MDWGSWLKDPGDDENPKAFAARTPLRELEVILPIQRHIGGLSGLWLGHVREGSFFPVLRGPVSLARAFRIGETPRPVVWALSRW